MNRKLITFACVLLLAGTLPACSSIGLANSFSTAGQSDRALVLINRDKNGLAIQGYDPVAYFTVGKPTKGNERFTSRYDRATYRFASAQNKALFDAEPIKYAPTYGGYCGYAASINRLSPIDPEYWQLVDGRLVLQHNKKAFDLWNKDVAANTVKADGNWPGLVARNGSPERVLVNTDDAGLALEGYDPVSYFEAQGPMRGSPEFEAVYNGARYQFVSMDHRVTFEQDPAHYAPQFGGYCGYAASIQKVSPVNPLIYQVIDDRLVLQHTDEAYRLFNKDARASLARADKNWPGLVQRRGK